MRFFCTILASVFLFFPVHGKSEVLNFYNWSDYISEDTLEKFTKKTGIEVNYDVFDSNEVLEAKILAGSSGYDLVVPTSDFLQKQIAAKVYQKIDKAKLKNYKNLDENLMKIAANHDANNDYSVIYMWGTSGIGIDKKKVRELLGEGAPLDSWALLFDIKYVSKLKDCGISLLDSPTEIIPMALNYLGFDPNSKDYDEIGKAGELIKSIKPYIRYFHSSQYVNDLANGDICLAVGWSGDVYTAANRAEEAKNGIEISYVIPKEGTLLWFDVLAIPADAPNAEAAYAFIDFFLQPEITADISNYVSYASANKEAYHLIDKEIYEDPNIFPPKEVKERLWSSEVLPDKVQRVITRLWSDIKSGG